MRIDDKLFSQDDFSAVLFDNSINSRIHAVPKYYELGFSDSPLIYGRKAVLTRLTKALDFLPESYGFLVWDVYRPRQVQAKVFDWMRNQIRKSNPQLTEEENFQEAKKFASVPSKVGESYCPPHLSGGAIDLTLFDRATNEPLNMGTIFDDCSNRAHANYFKTLTELSAEDAEIKKNRDMLSFAMKNAGFTTYEYEWWHFDIGDLFWGRMLNISPVFGPLFGDEEWPSELNVDFN